MLKKIAVTLSTLSMIALTAGCSQTETGKGGSLVSGSSGAGGTNGAATQLPQCHVPIGTAALVEPEGNTMTLLTAVGLQSPIPLLRLMMQQSNCFRVVDRGQALNNLKSEQELSASGMLKANSVTARGRVTTVQYLITPNITFSNPNSGGSSAGLAGVGGYLGLAAGLAGSIQTKEAESVLFVTDAISSEQIASAEGSAKSTDYGALGGIAGWGSGFAGVAGLSGYSNTAQGKVVAAALLDAYSKLVGQLQHQAVAPPTEIAPTPVPVYSAPVSTGSTSSPLVKSIQTELIRLGFYDGSPDGKIGPKTRGAISDFQKSKNMTPDGKPTSDLLTALKGS